MNTVSFSIKPILKHGIEKGIIGGGILAAFSAIIYIFNLNMFSPAIGLLSFVLTYGVTIVFMYRAAAAYRTEFNQPRIDYLSAALVLFFAGTVMFYISAVFSLLLNTIIDPNYHLELLKQFEENVLPQVPEEMREEMLVRTAENMQPVKQFISSLIASPIIALILALIMAFFVRKNPNYKETV